MAHQCMIYALKANSTSPVHSEIYEQVELKFIYIVQKSKDHSRARGYDLVSSTFVVIFLIFSQINARHRQPSDPQSVFLYTRVLELHWISHFAVCDVPVAHKCTKD